MNIRHTDRGFVIADFIDKYGVKCSIQKSSLAGEDCIWLGCNDAEPWVCNGNGTGWSPVPLPDGTVCNTRMHLTQDMVRELFPLLKKFVRTGELE